MKKNRTILPNQSDNTSIPKRRKAGSERLRVAANYVRLMASFALGLLLVRLLLQMGTEAYGLVIFLGAGTGIIGSLRETVAVSMVPELGAAYHDEDEDRFAAAYSSAYVLSAGLALLSLVIMLVIGICLPYCNIPADLISAARWFLVAKSIQAIFTVFLSPASNMYLVTERMVGFNAWMVAEKVGDTLAAVMILFGIGDLTAARLVVLYGIITATFAVGINFASTLQITLTDRRITAVRRHVSRQALHALTRSFGWNSGVTLAINLYTRMTALVMNLTFGLMGNVVFGIAVQVCANVRQVAMGLVTGIDAVAARLNSRQGQQAIRDLSYMATRLQALIVLPSVCWLMIYVDAFVTVWVGGRLENPDEMIPVIGNISRLLLLGVAARSLSEGWMRILSGAGHARKYAPVVLFCGLFNPILAVLLLSITSGDVRFASPTAALCVLMIVVHAIALPWIVARHLDQPIRRILGPIFRPALATTVTGGIAWLWLRVVPTESTLETLRNLASATIVYGLLYVALAIAIATTRRERARFSAWMRKREFVEHDAATQVAAPNYIVRAHVRNSLRRPND